MSLYKVLIKLRYIDCVKQRERDIRVYEATGTSPFQWIFATDTITLQMTLKSYEVISHNNKSCFSNSPIVSVFVQVTSSETPIWDTMTHQMISGHIFDPAICFSTSNTKTHFFECVIMMDGDNH